MMAVLGHFADVIQTLRLHIRRKNRKNVFDSPVTVNKVASATLSVQEPSATVESLFKDLGRIEGNQSK